jgi:hypothetical protein
MATKREKSLATCIFLVSLVALVAAAPSSGDAATSPAAAWQPTAPSSSAWSEPAAPAIAPSYPETRNRVSGKLEAARDQVSSELSRDLRQGYEQSCGWEAVGSLDAPGGGAQAAIRERVLANIEASKLARSKSNFRIRARRDLALDVYRSAGFSPDRTFDHMLGIDFTKPVELVTARQGRWFGQWQRPGRSVGNYFGFRGQPPLLGGVNPVGRVENLYRVSRPTQLLRSTAAAIDDIWSIPGSTVRVPGGGRQYFAPDPSAFVPVVP